MPHYRIKFGNRESIVHYDEPMSYVGEIYKDRLVGECDEYGNLRDVYISPELEEALAEAGREFLRLHPQYAVDAGVAIPKKVDEFSTALEPQKVISPEECGIYVCTPTGRKPTEHVHSTNDLLDSLPSSQLNREWKAIDPVPECFGYMERNLTPAGDIVETPITPEEPKLTESIFEIIAKQVVCNTPMCSLTPDGIKCAARTLIATVGGNAMGRMQYADWIMDHGESTLQHLIDVLCKDGVIPRDIPHAISTKERLVLVALIEAINDEMRKTGTDPHFIRIPERWFSAYDLYAANNPGETVEDFLRNCNAPRVEKNPNDPDPIKADVDPETVLKNLRTSVLNALDDWKRKIDIYHGNDLRLGEARVNLLERQFKHVRRYAKTIIKRVTGYGDDFELIHLDLAQQDHFGFVTKDRYSNQHTRHFTIKFVEYNWIIVEE